DRGPDRSRAPRGPATRRARRRAAPARRRGARRDRRRAPRGAPGRRDGGGAVALVAVGGYGRRELCPSSDLDLWFLVDGRGGEWKQLAEEVLYPLWDL